MKEINEHSHSAAGPVNGLMTYLPVGSLHPHPDNPRKDLGDLTELADSIRANGIFQNLTVIPVDDNFEQFTVVIGHRRLAAAKLAGLMEVPLMGHGFRTTGRKVGWKNDVQGREKAYAADCWCKTPTVIFEAAERLRGVQIENRPALELIDRFNFPNVLIYADPPYLLNTRYGKQYRCEMTDADHRDLLDALKAHRGPVLLSGYENSLYRDALKGWYTDTAETITQTSAKRREVLWMNFEPVVQEQLFL